MLFFKVQVRLSKPLWTHCTTVEKSNDLAFVEHMPTVLHASTWALNLKSGREGVDSHSTKVGEDSGKGQEEDNIFAQSSANSTRVQSREHVQERKVKWS